MKRRIATLLLVLVTGGAGAQVTVTEGTNFSVHAGRDARLVIDVLGSIWIVPQAGGVAEEVVSGPLTARRPRWSPSAAAIVYEAHGDGQAQLWLYDLGSDSARSISVDKFFDQHPAWHPDGERVVYSSDRRDSGFDLWELDLETGLTWRISHGAGDETEPAWSTDGRDLVYVHEQNDVWSLVLRRRGQPDRVIETARQRLSAPAWRPDGSLITFLRHGDDGLSIDMAILSDPPLIREWITGEDLFIAPVTWRGRQQLIYAANGLIRKRDFNAWRSTTLPFRVTVQPDDAGERSPPEPRQLPETESPAGQLVIRIGRVFDGTGPDYQENRDIVIRGNRIEAIEDQRDRSGANVVDLSDMTALPGFVDGLAALPDDTDPALGPVLLSFGVTTIVADQPNAESLNALWSGKDMPGPRVLGTAWQLGLDTAPSALLGNESLPASPAGVRYQDLRVGGGNPPAGVLSGLADARTEGLDRLLQVRQVSLLKQYPTTLRRFVAKPDLKALAASTVLGSRPNGLAPGIAQHAELRALSEAGLSGAEVLRTAGVNAAKALGLGTQLGRIAVGSSADIVLVAGDPLDDVSEAASVFGVVRNGRFFSTIGLIERAQVGNNVEFIDKNGAKKGDLTQKR